MRHHAITGFSASLALNSTGANKTRSLIPFGPIKAANISGEATFSGTTTGTGFVVRGFLSSGSTSPITVLTIKSSQKSTIVTSTVAKWIMWVRIDSTIGVWTASKTAQVQLAGTP